MANFSLAEWIDRQYRLSADWMLQSISAVHLVKQRPGFGQTVRPVKGSVLASPALAAYDPDPDYFFHWLRDSAIVIDALTTLIEEGVYGPEGREHVSDFVRFSLALGDLDGRALLKASELPRAVDPKFQQYLRGGDELREVFGDRVLGETRFNPDGALDIARWARPQHDGPALRALLVMRCWRLGFFEAPDISESARRLIETDLAFVHRHWREPSFDIWEEESGDHYYTRLVQYAALCDGAAWRDERGEAECADACRADSREILQSLDSHWDEARGFYRSRFGATSEGPRKELDIATILAVLHTGRTKGVHSVQDPKSQVTLARLEDLFAREYPINAATPPGRGVAMGRYAGDRYYSGGAYYFATLGAAEFFFRLAEALAQNTRAHGGPIKPGPNRIPAALVRRGDEFMCVVRAYTPATGELSEQFDRADGRQTSARNLAWSHAAFITAATSRRSAIRAFDQAATS